MLRDNLQLANKMLKIFSHEKYKVTQEISFNSISLPTSNDLSKTEADYISAVFLEDRQNSKREPHECSTLPNSSPPLERSGRVIRSVGRPTRANACYGARERRQTRSSQGGRRGL